MLEPDKKIEQKQQVDDMLSVAQQRDKAAYARLFDHFAPLIRHYCLSAYPGAPMMADEITQDVMLKVWRKAHTYNSKASAVSTWIFTLARNARIDYLRKNSRHQSDIDPEFIWNEMSDDTEEPFARAQQKRNEEEVNAAVGELPVEQQQVLAKVYMEGKSHTEVADELSIPLGTVKSRLRIALNKMSVLIRR